MFFTHSFFLVCFFFFGCTHGIWKFLGQESNPSCGCYLCQSCSNTGSLTHCTTVGTPAHCSFYFNEMVVIYLFFLLCFDFVYKTLFFHLHKFEIFMQLHLSFYGFQVLGHVQKGLKHSKIQTRQIIYLFIYFAFQGYT